MASKLKRVSLLSRFVRFEHRFRKLGFRSLDASGSLDPLGFDAGRRYERFHSRWDESTAFASDLSVLI